MTHYSPTPHIVHCPPPLSHPPPPSPHPLLPLPLFPSPSFPSSSSSAAEVVVGCRRCCSARSLSSSPSPHRHHNHHQPHHHRRHHHHHHYRHRSYSPPAALSSFPSPLHHHHRHHHHHHRRRHSCRDVLQRVDKSHHTRSRTAKRDASFLGGGGDKGDSWSKGDLRDTGSHQGDWRDSSRSQVDWRDFGSLHQQADWRDSRSPVKDGRHSGCGLDGRGATSRHQSSPGAEPVRTAAAAASSRKTLLGCCQALLVVPALLLLVLLPHRRKSRRHQLTQLPRLLLWLCVLTAMVASRCCLASPWIEENASSVKLRAKVCQPVPDEHLRSRLGAAYDPSRMSNQDPRSGSGSGSSSGGKRSDPSSAPEMEEAAFDSYYMEDDPGAREYVNEDFVDIVTSRDGEEEEEDWFRREEEVEEEDDGLEVEEKDLEEEEGRRFYQKKRVGKIDSSPPQSDQPKSRDRRPDPDQLYLYMKRRRRATPPSSDRDRDRSQASSEDGGGGGFSNKDKKNKDSLLPLRLLLSGRNRKLRRKLKKAFRKKAKKLGKKPPPWTCNMTKVWGRLKEGYFPRYLLDGRCATDKCFYRLYDCVPQKYRVKVLKRDPDYCNPLPALGANTTYEQKWSVVRYYVTVGCNCEASDPLQSGGRSRSGRRRNS